MLEDRCQTYGLSEAGAEIESAWLGTARLLRLREDYEGTWCDEFFMPLRKMLDDMIEERLCVTLRQTKSTPPQARVPNPVALPEPGLAPVRDRPKWGTNLESVSCHFTLP